MKLEKNIEKLRKEIKSERLSMSIGELAGLYQRNELDIHPKFQRVLRWDREQKSRLIESILLRIPIPPIFVAQDAEGAWDVVDGVQRLGTIFEFLGMLRNRDGKAVPALVLEKTHLLPDLQGITFGGSGKTSLPKSLQLDFRRARLDLEILLRESDSSAKYELFERLNTGGSIASDQEVRNCVMVWINEERFDWLEELSKDKSFNGTVELTERAEERQYRMELVLRFLAFSRMADESLKEITDIGAFLNEANREFAKSKDIDEDELGQLFADTFGIVDDALGSDAFKKYTPASDRFSGAFLISAFEAIAIGVAANIEAWRKAKRPEKKLRELVKSLWSQREFTSHIGIGVPARDRIRWSVPFGRKHFAV